MSEDGLAFCRPAEVSEEEAAAFLEAFRQNGDEEISGSGGLDYFPTQREWREYLERVETGQEEGLVPSRVYFVRQAATGSLVGVVDIRPTLPEEKRDWGHLGYSVAPAFRGRGYGLAIARWGAAKLREAGVEEVLACIFEENEASRRVLEKAGFCLTDSYTYRADGRNCLVYTL